MSPCCYGIYHIGRTPLLRLLQAMLSDQGTVQACADDTGMVLSPHGMSPAARVFHLPKLRGNLGMSIPECVLAPPFVAGHS